MTEEETMTKYGKIYSFYYNGQNGSATPSNVVTPPSGSCVAVANYYQNNFSQSINAGSQQQSQIQYIPTWPLAALGGQLGIQNYYGQIIGYTPAQSVLYSNSGWDGSLPPESDEQKNERLKREVQRKAAAARAEKLLFTILTPAQVRSYSDDNYFDIPVNERTYRLRKGRSMNVELIEAGKAKIKFCAHPDNAHDVPIPDVMLSQLLMLQANEAEFLRIANRRVIQ
jgi:hypothetical protein